MDSSSHVTDLETNTSRNEKHPVVDSIETTIDGLPDISPSCCIYKTPATICRLKERLYTPQQVSLGPFHHGSQKLKDKEEHKLEYLKAFLRRTKLSLQVWMNIIQNWEKNIRDCYAERIDLKQDEFLRMVLVDSCFIMESILAHSKNIYARKIYLNHDSYLSMRDMVLLENQLPFFVLNGLYDLAFPDAETEFLEYSIRFFYYSTLMSRDNQNELIGRVKQHIRKGHKILHFVDLLRLCHLPTTLKDKNLPRRVSLVTIPKAADLQGAGIKLKIGSSKFTLDIKYADGALEIPQLVVYEGSEYLISNILVLEMCHYRFDSYVRDYIVFMDQLIDTRKDVDLLIEKGIMENDGLSDSSAVANLFNNVGYDFPVIGYKYYFYDISQELNAYCSVPWHRWKAAFKRDYWSTPWLMASTIAAVTLLFLTFISTLCSIISAIQAAQQL